MQAALPQGIVPFVFAKEYNVHPAVLSTGYSMFSVILLKSSKTIQVSETVSFSL